MASAFRGVIEFFNQLGMYDVLLPFLLVYTIVFAIMEKTRVFGTEEFEGKRYPRKNLNAMMAFVTAFFVIASSRLVELVTEVSANMVILLMMSVLFLLLYGSFQKETPEGIYLDKLPKTLLGMVMAVGIALIFLHAMQTSDGTTWLDISLKYVSGFWESTALSAIAMTVVVVAAMAFVTKDNKEKAEPKKE